MSDIAAVALLMLQLFDHFFDIPINQLRLCGNRNCGVAMQWPGL